VQPSDLLVSALTVLAVQVQDNFKAQNIANTLWAFATLQILPSGLLLAGLKMRSVVLVDTFIPLDISSTLWAFAKMGLQR